MPYKTLQTEEQGCRSSCSDTSQTHKEFADKHHPSKFDHYIDMSLNIFNACLFTYMTITAILDLPQQYTLAMSYMKGHHIRFFEKPVALILVQFKIKL